MLRAYALWTLVAILTVYAWRDWFKSLCGLILLMAVIEQPDMPKSIMGIQGLNPWNILMVSVVLSWAVSRRREGLVWDMPRPIAVLLLLYLGVVLAGFARLMADRSHLEGTTTLGLVSENLINTIKWTIPGLLLFDGCRNPQRLRLAILSSLGLYLLLALQVARDIPPIALLEQSREVARMRLRRCDRIGYSACDTSTMLAGASWAMVACLPLCRARWAKVLIGGAALVTAYSQALTGGRAGYMAWAGVGLTLCFLKWRKFLLLAPVVPILLFALFPGAAARALQGFGEMNVAGEAAANVYEVTSGRALIWPYVVDKIGESPAMGCGRLAMQRTGLTGFLAAQIGEGPAHPHNAYLEWLLDNGAVGMIPVALFFGIILVWSATLFRDADNPWCAAVGGMAFSLLLAQLVGGIGAQHFYPRESTLGLWAAIFLMLRVYVERRKALASLLLSSVQHRMPRLNRGSVVPIH
jgi:O-antigen ligase